MAEAASAVLSAGGRLVAGASALLLIGANLLPLLGVLFWGWDAFVLLMLYWLETAVIAFWTVLRIASLRTPPLVIDERKTSSFGLALFFTAHAGLFMGVHFMFLWGLFAGDWARKIHGLGDFVNRMVVDTQLWVPLLALFVIRGLMVFYDIAMDWVSRRALVEGGTPAPQDGGSVVAALYARIVVMQVAIIAGAWVALVFGSKGVLAVLVLIKTALDVSFPRVVAHIRATMTRASALPGQK